MSPFQLPALAPPPLDSAWAGLPAKHGWGDVQSLTTTHEHSRGKGPAGPGGEGAWVPGTPYLQPAMSSSINRATRESTSSAERCAFRAKWTCSRPASCGTGRQGLGGSPWDGPLTPGTVTTARSHQNERTVRAKKAEPRPHRPATVLAQEASRIPHTKQIQIPKPGTPTPRALHGSPSSQV